MGRLRPASYRWEYQRDQDLISCELSVSPRRQRYRLSVAHDGWSSVEDFADLLTAINRHVTLERDLIASGWSLSDYERVTRVTARARQQRRSASLRYQLPLLGLENEDAE